MSNLRTGPKPRPTGPSEADGGTRPQLWVEGRQQPKFDLRAWGRVSLTMTTRRLAPTMTNGATRTEAFARRILQGELRPNLAWTGRAQRFIPSHQAVGEFVLGCANLLADAREVVQPTPPPAAPIAYPNLIRPNFAERPARTAPRQLAAVALPEPIEAPAGPPDESTLRVIRSMIGTPDAPAQPAPQAASATTAPPLLRRTGSAISGLVWRAGACCLAWGLTAVAFPIGGVNAALFHLNGGDLRDWS